MVDVEANVLRALASEMDREYERLARVQHVDRLGRRRSSSGCSAGELQIGGRLDMLAFWACRLRCEADAIGGEA